MHDVLDEQKPLAGLYKALERTSELKQWRADGQMSTAIAMYIHGNIKPNQLRPGDLMKDLAYVHKMDADGNSESIPIQREVRIEDKLYMVWIATDGTFHAYEVQ